MAEPAPIRAGLPVLRFADAQALAGWLAAQPADAAGAWLMFAKKDGGGASLSKSTAIDVALCHGWIDGQLARHDDAYSLARFTPRRPGSKWSELNRRRAEALIAAGQMAPAGLREVEQARADGRWQAAYAPASTATVPSDLQAALDAEPAAAAFFATLSGANRYAILYRIGAVKQAETRARRIAAFVAMLARGETIYR